MEGMDLTARRATASAISVATESELTVVEALVAERRRKLTTAEPLTMDTFIAKAYAAFPGSEVGEENDGQLVVYTGLKAEVSPTVAAGDAARLDSVHVVPFEATAE